MNQLKEFPAIEMSFESNLLSLRVFNNSIGEFADEYDRKVLEEFSQALKDTLGYDPEDHVNSDNNGAALAEAPPNEIKEKFHIKFNEKPELFRELMSIFSSFEKGSVGQGFLLRQGALVILVTYFETLISDLIENYYYRYPEGLPSNEAQLNLSELRMLGSVDDAEKYIISKESESVLRQNTNAQLEYFNKRFKINLKPIDFIIDDLHEIILRRNIFVHNSGVVNKIYLSQVSKELIEDYEAKENERLSISKDYLSHAIDTVYIVGNILIQLCWRKWDKDNINAAESILVKRIYESLAGKLFEITICLAKFGYEIGFSEDIDHRLTTINRAIALKELGKLEEMEALLSSLDWSSSSIKFILGLHCLRDDKDQVFKLIPKAIAAEEITKESMTEWPIFWHIREDQEFIGLFNHYFPDEKSD